ncbi:6-phosphogluconolactonase [Oceanobacter mangrovi]|uniref:6-phosphogluconolactonase n=1 Tax=Oceanobacter mangrovi TaxID=2862510 RepID=UPI001C8E3117|nr:6-phosphogluconolactonase [Oceanobacter mangrovi]
MSDNRYESSEVLARQLAEAVADQLAERVADKGRACLAVSGGKTPQRFFELLSEQNIPWGKILVTLVDERWVDETSPDSNAALVRQHLLRNKAAAAYFLPLKNAAKTPVDGFMECENRLHEQIINLDVAVLGMGNDGHTASWFPHSKALDACMNEAGAAWSCPVMDSELNHPRMTLTWSMLSRCQKLFLHFEGEEKNRVYAQACTPTEKQNLAAMPIRTLLFQSEVPLSIYRTV